MGSKPYTPQQDSEIIKILSEHEYVNVQTLKDYTDSFNKKYGEDRSVTGIASRFRVLKSKTKLPAVIAYKELYPDRVRGTSVNKGKGGNSHYSKWKESMHIYSEFDSMSELTNAVDALISAYCKVHDHMKALKSENDALQSIKNAMEKFMKGE